MPGMPDGQIRGHHLNWNKRLGAGQDLGQSVLGNDRCPVACGKMASRNIQRADFHGAWKDPIAPSNQATQTKRVFPDRH
jgi:hypothetical protein